MKNNKISELDDLDFISEEYFESFEDILARLGKTLNTYYLLVMFP